MQTSSGVSANLQSGAGVVVGSAVVGAGVVVFVVVVGVVDGFLSLHSQTLHFFTDSFVLQRPFEWSKIVPSGHFNLGILLSQQLV